MYKITDGFVEIMDAAIKDSIHRAPPIDQEPHVQLTKWRVFEVSIEDVTTRHFIGWAEYEGRVSSNIVTFDPATKKGVSRSGRVYELEGNSGFDQDALYVWNQWIRTNGFVAHQKDITDQYE